jgi:signal transduction histidine kinase
LGVSLAADCEWLVSEALLRQVIGNLVSNAIDSLDSISKPQKKILIKSFVRDKHLCIDVIDNGPGVASNKRQNLFSLFATTKKKGAGVGLWLSKSIIEQHAGRIYYAEGLEGEAIFSIEIPDASKRQSNTR